jgi:hypothetical protein
VREWNDLMVTFLAGGPISRAGQTPVMPFRPRWLRSQLGHRGFQFNYNCPGVVVKILGDFKEDILHFRNADGGRSAPRSSREPSIVKACHRPGGRIGALVRSNVSVRGASTAFV